MNDHPDDAELFARTRAAFRVDVSYAVAIAEAAHKIEARRAQQVKRLATLDANRGSAAIGMADGTIAS